MKKHVNSEVQSSEHTLNGPKSTNDKLWHFEPIEVNFYFLKGELKGAGPLNFDRRHGKT